YLSSSLVATLSATMTCPPDTAITPRWRWYSDSCTRELCGSVRYALALYAWIQFRFRNSSANKTSTTTPTRRNGAFMSYLARSAPPPRRLSARWSSQHLGGESGQLGGLAAGGRAGVLGSAGRVGDAQQQPDE